MEAEAATEYEVACYGSCVNDGGRSIGGSARASEGDSCSGACARIGNAGTCAADIRCVSDACCHCEFGAGSAAGCLDSDAAVCVATVDVIKTVISSGDGAGANSVYAPSGECDLGRRVYYKGSVFARGCGAGASVGNVEPAVTIGGSDDKFKSLCVYGLVTYSSCDV